MIAIKNLLKNIPEKIPTELLQMLVQTDYIKIERIISKGQATATDSWYDQMQNEWVMVLKGQAGLLFQGSEEVLVLGPGDYVNIPARKKHRVEWTEENSETVWLAVFYK